MSDCLHPCEACERHIKRSETACPFCGATLAEGFGACAKTPSRATAPLTRAAILFVGAAAAAACGGGVESGDDAGDVADASNDGSSSDAAPDTGGPVPMYGPVPVDAMPPTDSATTDADTGGPVALYGPVPVDSGNGG